MLEQQWFRSLMISGLFASVQKAVAAIPGIGPLAAPPLSVVTEVISGCFTSRAASQLDRSDFEAQALRNHHLRRGMAVALRSGLKRAQVELSELSPIYSRLFPAWETMLQLAETGNRELDLLFPAEQFAESHWEAINDYSAGPAQDLLAAQSLANILREWLLINPGLRRDWGKTRALEFAQRALPYYQRAFADDLAGDSAGMLFRAFTVKGINQLRALLQRLIENNQELHAKTHRALAEIDLKVGSVSRHNCSFRATDQPLKTPYFVGHTEFIEALHQNLSEHRQALVSASGGFGKTQVALEYVHQYGDSYEDVVWIRAFDGASILDRCRQIAKDLGRPAKTDGEVQNSIKRWFQEHPRALLVLDGLDDPEVVKAYWPTASIKPFVLATSRKHNLTELADMPRMALAEWKPEEALKFLQLRTGKATLCATERIAAETLANETGYLPLALEQAASYIVMAEDTFSAYLATYQTIRTTTFESADHQPTAGDYRNSVIATLRASLEHLPEAARELIAAASHLDPSLMFFELFSGAPEALGPVLNRALLDRTKSNALAALLGRLQQYSLVQMDRERGTFSMHKLLHQVVREQQSENERSEWITRWTEVFLHYLPDNVGHKESLPHARAWAAFNQMFMRVAPDHPAFRAAVYVALNYVRHFNLRGRWLEIQPFAVHLLGISEQVLGPDDITSVKARRELAVLYLNRGRYAESEQLFLQLTSRVSPNLGYDDDEMDAIDGLARVCQLTGRLSEAESYWRRSFDSRTKELGREDYRTLISAGRLAYCLTRREDGHEAETLLLTTLEALNRLYGNQDPQAIEVSNCLALFYASRNRYSEAERIFRQALLHLEETLGPNHPQTLTLLSNLGGTLAKLRRHDEAQGILICALESSERLLGRDQNETLGIMTLLAESYLFSDRTSKAKALLIEVIELRTRLYGPDDPSLMQPLVSLGMLLGQEGYSRDSQATLRQAVALGERLYGRDDSRFKMLCQLVSASGRPKRR